MAIKSLHIWSFASVGLLATGLIFYLFFCNQAMDTNNIPTLRLRLGQNYFDILRGNHFNHDISNNDDKTPVVIETPVQLDFAEPQIGFKLPPTRYLYLSQYAGIVTNIMTTPQLQLWNLKKSHDFAAQMTINLRKMGWIVHREYPLPYEMVKSMYAEAKTNNEKFWKIYGEFTSGSIRVYIEVKQVIHPETHPLEKKDLTENDDIFLVNINIDNEELRSQQFALVDKQRQEVNGTIYKALPISYW